jgi:hypothetical protein
MNPTDTQTYSTWQKYCYKILETSTELSSFKQDPSIQYMTEHDELTRFVMDWSKEIQRIQKEHGISDYLMMDLIHRNERIGDSKKNVNYSGLQCNANTVKYCLFALQVYDYLHRNELTNTCIIEIGGGYGGFMLVLNYLLRYMNFPVKEYRMIDIPGVIHLQQRYLEENGIRGIQYVSALPDPDNRLPSIQTLRLSKNEKYFLFSSYSLSELSKEARQLYYENLFSHINHGFLYWNIPEIDIPFDFTVHTLEEIPRTGENNRIVQFYRVS